jgi:hypothetical protein
MEFNIWILSDIQTGQDKEIVWMDENPCESERLDKSTFLPIFKPTGSEPTSQVNVLEKKCQARKLMENEYTVIEPLTKLGDTEAIKIGYKKHQYVLSKRDGYSSVGLLKN